MDKLAALRAFVEVAEAGGFSKAARRLGVAASSVTRQVDSLEEELGTPLLTRNTRAVSLTDAGTAYLDQVSRLLAELQEADQSISDTGAEPAGPLRVAVPVTFGRLCLGPHVASFLRAHPRVSLDMLLSDAFTDLAGERIDVAVRIGVPADEPGLIVKKLGEHHRFVVASHDYLAAHGEPEAPEGLADHECMKFSYRPGPQRWRFRRATRAVEVEVKGRFSVNNSDLLREAALDGHGIALLPQWLVHEDVRAGKLRRLFEDWQVNPQSESVCVYAAYLPNRRQSRKVRAFLDFLQSHVGGPLEVASMHQVID